MLNKIEKWIANPKRKYADGVGFFNRFASAAQKENFSKFFEVKEDETVEQFDIRFTTLVNQMLFVQRRIKSNPELFIESKSNAANSDSQISTGEKKSEQKAINIDEIPEELAPERDRLKELVPMMAKLHADMADEKIADDHRAAIRNELIRLDNERRAIWKKIDSVGISVEKPDKETEVETNMVAIGAQTALRIGQLKGYITRNKNALKTHIEAGNEKKADNARTKLDENSKELEELQRLIDGE